MKGSTPSPAQIDTNPHFIAPTPKGFILFCEKNLRYERGLKAWLFLGAYLLGACVLELLISKTSRGNTQLLWPWFGLLAYLVLFPRAPKWLSAIVAGRSAKSAPTPPR